MGSIAVARAGLRARATALVALTVLVALVGGSILGLAAGARRTVSAVDRLRTSSLAADLVVQPDRPDEHVDELRTHPDVAAVGIRGVAFLKVPGSDVDFGTRTVSTVALDEEYLRTIERPRLLSGSLPDPDDPLAVVLTESGAAAYGAGAGDELPLESLSPAQMESFIFEGQPLKTFGGPALRVHVTGVVRTLDEALGEPRDDIIHTPAFWERYRDDIGGFDNIVLVRVREGASLAPVIEEVRRLWADDDELFVAETAAEAAGADDLVRTQATALAVAAAIVIVAGLVIVGQAMTRHAASAAADDQALEACGLTRNERTLGTLMPLLAVAVAGAAAAGLGAALASGVFPSGGAAGFEPSPGLRFDLLVLVGGALSITVITASAGAWAARRSTRRGRTPATLGPVARMMARSPVVTSTAFRLATRRGVPTRPALGGAVAALAGAVAAITLGASLDRFVDDPARDGWNWDAEVGIGDLLSDDEARDVAAAVAADPRVQGVALARLFQYPLAGREVQMIGVESVEDNVGLTVVRGRSPSANDEIGLGAETADTLGVSIGEIVELEGADGDARRFTLTGHVRFPIIERDAPADGIALTLEALAALVPPSPEDGAAGYPTLLTTWAPGVDPAAALDHFASRFSLAEGPRRSSEATNLEEVRGTPLLLAVALALLGAAAVAHALSLSARHARHDLGVLAAVGFRRRQRSLTMLTQAVGYAAVGLIVGLPLGLVVGRWSWRLLAGSLGAGDDAVVPATVALLVPVAVAVVAIAALLPARAAARTQPAVALRTE